MKNQNNFVSFQVEGAEAPIPEGRQELPGTYKKQKQDISESFYKFEIRNLLDENETKSVISGCLWESMR